MPYKDKEKQKAYCRDYQARDRKTLKNIKMTNQLKRGATVKVFNRTCDGKEIFEGKAVLVQKLLPEKYQEYWHVRFPDGSVVCRWIRAEDALDSSVQTNQEEKKQ